MTGSLPADQYNSCQLPFMDFGDVPLPDSQITEILARKLSLIALN